jgi:hypothetical protein
MITRPETRHSVCIAFPANVAKVILAKQADFSRVAQ